MSNQVTTITVKEFQTFMKLQQVIDSAVNRGKYKTHDLVIKEFSFQNGDTTIVTEFVPKQNKIDDIQFVEMLNDAVGEEGEPLATVK